MPNEIHNQIDSLGEYVDLDEQMDEAFLLPDDHLICECNCVSAGDIRREFFSNKKIDTALLKRKYQFSTGCGSCLRNIEDWQKKIFKE